MRSAKELKDMFANVSNQVNSLSNIKAIQRKIEAEAQQGMSSEQKKEFQKVKKQAEKVGATGDFSAIIDLERKFREKI